MGSLDCFAVSGMERGRTLSSSWPRSQHKSKVNPCEFQSDLRNNAPKGSGDWDLDVGDNKLKIGNERRIETFDYGAPSIVYTH